MVQCNPLALSQGVDPVQFVPCAEICMAQAPKMLNATFSDSGTKIQVSVCLGVCAGRTGGYGADARSQDSPNRVLPDAA